MGVFYIIPAGLLSVPYIQKKISSIASNELNNVLGVPVKIGKVDFELFNKLIVKDLYLEDQQGEVLFQAERLAAGFDFLPLFKGKIRFRSAQLFSFNFNLSKEDDDSPLNLQFVIDAFAKKDTAKKENVIDLAIRNLNLRRGSFSFDVKTAQRTHGKFNSKHLEFNDISSKIHLKNLTNSECIAEINRLSFKEQSGLIVKRIALELNFSKDSAGIKSLEMLLPNSSLVLNDIRADFKGASNIDEYINNSYFSLQIAPSKICLKDLSAFVPAFENYRDLLDIQGDISGQLDCISLDNFFLTDDDKLLLQANIQLENLSNENELFISGAVKKSFIAASEIEKIAQNLSEKSINLPKEILRLGNMRFEGEMSGYFRHLTAYGLFNTDVGNIRTDIQIGKNGANFIKGEIKSEDLDLYKIFQNEDYGMANFNIAVNARQNFAQKYEGTVNIRINTIELKHYVYENADLIGDFTENSFNGTLNINCPDGKLTSKGLVQLNGRKSVFNFSARAEQVRLDRLNLTNKYKNSDFSFDINADFTGNNIDNALGSINVNDFRFNTEKGGYYLDTLIISSRVSESDNKILSINSKLINGNITGHYSFKDIVPALMETGNIFLPALIKAPKNKIVSENNFNIDLKIEDLKEFSNVFDLPVTLYEQTQISGRYNHASNAFKLEVLSPQFSFNKMLFRDCSIVFKNKNDEASLSVYATNTKNKINALFDIAGNNIKSKLIWNDKHEQYNGIFNLSAKFIEQGGAFPLKTEINLLESKATFKDSIWNINPAKIVLDSAKININHLFVNHSDQYVKVNGIISKNLHDSLRVDLNKVNLDYIFDILTIRTFELGGIVSGYATANDLFHTRQLSTRLKAENFSFNRSVVGNLNLVSLWDDERQGIQLLGDIYKNDSSKVRVDGAIFPMKKAVDLKFKAKNVDIAFLRRYLDNVAKNISGSVTGDINLFGNFSNVTLAGNAFVKNGSFGIDFLNTTYTFSDYVYFKPDEIYVKNVAFYDKFGRKALATGSVKHRYLKDYVFSANVYPTNFLVFDAPEKKNPNFFGSAFGTGSVSIKGNESQINFGIKLQSNEKTKMTLNFMEQPDIEEYNFVNFVSKGNSDSQTFDKLLSQFSKPVFLNSGSGADIKLSMELTATPDATINIIMDPITGSKLEGYGQGNINLLYGTKDPLKLYGTYTLEKGIYDFIFKQALIRRKFQIRDGSSITFRGDPDISTLDINATYSLSANVSDLSETFAEASKMNVPINCVLKITGELERPDVKFDIEAPNDNEIERQIKAIINTEEVMNRQIVYLLILNRFYTETARATTQRNNEFASLAASTLSSQLSNLFGSLNKNIQIGAIITTSDNTFTDTEYALMLSSQLLNNRLIINGNLGYRDNSTNPNSNTSFIGDFDLEYKLTKLGDIRLKAYNHYNDQYYSLRSAYTTQGIGLLYRKNFNNFKYLFRKRPALNISPPAPAVAEKDTITSVTTY